MSMFTPQMNRLLSVLDRAYGYRLNEEDELDKAASGYMQLGRTTRTLAGKLASIGSLGLSVFLFHRINKRFRTKVYNQITPDRPYDQIYRENLNKVYNAPRYRFTHPILEEAPFEGEDPIYQSYRKEHLKALKYHDEQQLNRKLLESQGTMGLPREPLTTTIQKGKVFDDTRFGNNIVTALNNRVKAAGKDNVRYEYDPSTSKIKVYNTALKGRENVPVEVINIPQVKTLQDLSTGGLPVKLIKYGDERTYALDLGEVDINKGFVDIPVSTEPLSELTSRNMKKITDKLRRMKETAIEGGEVKEVRKIKKALKTIRSNYEYKDGTYLLKPNLSNQNMKAVFNAMLDNNVLPRDALDRVMRVKTPENIVISKIIDGFKLENIKAWQDPQGDGKIRGIIEGSFEKLRSELVDVTDASSTEVLSRTQQVRIPGISKLSKWKVGKLLRWLGIKQGMLEPEDWSYLKRARNIQLNKLGTERTISSVEKALSTVIGTTYMELIGPGEENTYRDIKKFKKKPQEYFYKLPGPVLAAYGKMAETGRVTVGGVTNFFGMSPSKTLNTGLFLAQISDSEFGDFRYGALSKQEKTLLRRNTSFQGAQDAKMLVRMGFYGDEVLEGGLHYYTNMMMGKGKKRSLKAKLLAGTEIRRKKITPNKVVKKGNKLQAYINWDSTINKYISREIDMDTGMFKMKKPLKINSSTTLYTDHNGKKVTVRDVFKYPVKNATMEGIEVHDGSVRVVIKDNLPLGEGVKDPNLKTVGAVLSNKGDGGLAPESLDLATSNIDELITHTEHIKKGRINVAEGFVLKAATDVGESVSEYLSKTVDNWNSLRAIEKSEMINNYIRKTPGVLNRFNKAIGTLIPGLENKILDIKYHPELGVATVDLSNTIKKQGAEWGANYIYFDGKLHNRDAFEEFDRIMTSITADKLKTKEYRVFQTTQEVKNKKFYGGMIEADKIGTGESARDYVKRVHLILDHGSMKTSIKNVGGESGVMLGYFEREIIRDLGLSDIHAIMELDMTRHREYAKSWWDIFRDMAEGKIKITEDETGRKSPVRTIGTPDYQTKGVTVVGRGDKGLEITGNKTLTNTVKDLIDQKVFSVGKAKMVMEDKQHMISSFKDNMDRILEKSGITDEAIRKDMVNDIVSRDLNIEFADITKSTFLTRKQLDSLVDFTKHVRDIGFAGKRDKPTGLSFMMDNMFLKQEIKEGYGSHPYLRLLVEGIKLPKFDIFQDIVAMEVPSRMETGPSGAVNVKYETLYYSPHMSEVIRILRILDREDLTETDRRELIELTQRYHRRTWEMTTGKHGKGRQLLRNRVRYGHFGRSVNLETIMNRYPDQFREYKKKGLLELDAIVMEEKAFKKALRSVIVQDIEGTGEMKLGTIRNLVKTEVDGAFSSKFLTTKGIGILNEQASRIQHKMQPLYRLMDEIPKSDMQTYNYKVMETMEFANRFIGHIKTALKQGEKPDPEEWKISNYIKQNRVEDQKLMTNVELANHIKKQFFNSQDDVRSLIKGDGRIADSYVNKINLMNEATKFMHKHGTSLDTFVKMNSFVKAYTDDVRTGNAIVTGVFGGYPTPGSQGPFSGRILLFSDTEGAFQGKIFGAGKALEVALGRDFDFDLNYGILDVSVLKGVTTKEGRLGTATSILREGITERRLLNDLGRQVDGQVVPMKIGNKTYKVKVDNDFTRSYFQGRSGSLMRGIQHIIDNSEVDYMKIESALRKSGVEDPKQLNKVMKAVKEEIFTTKSINTKAAELAEQVNQFNKHGITGEEVIAHLSKTRNPLSMKPTEVNDWEYVTNVKTVSRELVADVLKKQGVSKDIIDKAQGYYLRSEAELFDGQRRKFEGSLAKRQAEFNQYKKDITAFTVGVNRERNLEIGFNKLATPKMHKFTHTIWDLASSMVKGYDIDSEGGIKAKQSVMKLVNLLSEGLYQKSMSRKKGIPIIAFDIIRQINNLASDNANLREAAKERMHSVNFAINMETEQWKDMQKFGFVGRKQGTMRINERKTYLALKESVLQSIKETKSNDRHEIKKTAQTLYKNLVDYTSDEGVEFGQIGYDPVVTKKRYGDTINRLIQEFAPKKAKGMIDKYIEATASTRKQTEKLQGEMAHMLNVFDTEGHSQIINLLTETRKILNKKTNRIDALYSLLYSKSKMDLGNKETYDTLKKFFRGETGLGMIDDVMGKPGSKRGKPLIHIDYEPERPLGYGEALQRPGYKDALSKSFGLKQQKASTAMVQGFGVMIGMTLLTQKLSNLIFRSKEDDDLISGKMHAMTGAEFKAKKPEIHYHYQNQSGMYLDAYRKERTHVWVQPHSVINDDKQRYTADQQAKHNQRFYGFNKVNYYNFTDNYTI